MSHINLPNEIDIDRWLAARSLYEFVQLAWHVVEPATPFVRGRHIEILCEHLEAVTAGQIQNILIMVPPGSTKSITTGVCWPAWEWATINAATRWLFSSYALNLAERDSEKCGNLIRSKWYQARWGSKFRLTTDARIQLQNDKTGFREVASVNSAVTGSHADRLVIDDPHNVQEVESQVTREATIRWHDQAWFNRVNDARKSSRVVIGQRTHEKDLLGHLETTGGYVILRLPEEYDAGVSRTWVGATRKDWRTEPGQLLRPERFGPEQVEEAKKRLGSYGYAAQHQQTPMPASGGFFQKAWLRHYSLPNNGEHVQVASRVFSLRECWFFITCDLATSTKTSADYTVIAVWAVDGNKNLLLVDLVRDRMEAPEVLAKLWEMQRRWRAAYVGIETHGYQLATFQTAMRNGLPVRRLEAHADKVARATTAQVRMENGQVWFPEDAPWLPAIEHELLTFPKGAHDDFVDALAYAAIEVEANLLPDLGPDFGVSFVGTGCPAAQGWKNSGGGGPYGGSRDYLGPGGAGPSVPYISRDLTPPGYGWGRWDDMDGGCGPGEMGCTPNPDYNPQG